MKSLKYFYISVMCLLFLGNSFLFGKYNVPLFSLMGYTLAFFYCYVFKVGISYRDWYFVVVYFTVSIISIIFTFIYIETRNISITFNTFLGVLLGLIFYTILKNSTIKFADFQKQLLLALKITLIVSLIFLYIQFFSYFIFDSHIDYMKPVTGESQRLLGYTQNIYGHHFQRVSGIFAEPAVYAFITNALMIIIIRHKAMPMWLFILSGCSVFLTFSASGIVLVIIPLTMYFFSLNKQKKFFVIALLSILIELYNNDLYNLFNQQFDRVINFQSDPSAASRLNFVSFFYSHLNVFFFGYGIFADLKSIVPPAIFLTSMIYNFGIFLSVIIIVPMLSSAYRRMDFFDFCLFLLFGVMLNYPNSSPFFWFIYSVLYVSLSKHFVEQKNSQDKGVMEDE